MANEKQFNWKEEEERRAEITNASSHFATLASSSYPFLLFLHLLASSSFSSTDTNCKKRRRMVGKERGGGGVPRRNVWCHFPSPSSTSSRHTWLTPKERRGEGRSGRCWPGLWRGGGGDEGRRDQFRTCSLPRPPFCLVACPLRSHHTRSNSPLHPEKGGKIVCWTIPRKRMRREKDRLLEEVGAT